TTSKVSRQRTLSCLLTLEIVAVVLEERSQHHHVAVGHREFRIVVSQAVGEVLTSRRTGHRNLGHVLAPYAELPSSTGQGLSINRLLRNLHRLRVDQELESQRRSVYSSTGNPDDHVLCERLLRRREIEIIRLYKFAILAASLGR